MNFRRNRKSCQCRRKRASSRRWQRPLFELLEARHMMAAEILRQAPIGVVGDAVREIELEFSASLLAESARTQANYRLTYFGEDGVAGGGDDAILPILPQYVDGSTMLRLSTLADLTGWTEVDYGFPQGILGDWRLDATTGSVLQTQNGGATFFVSDEELSDREFAAQLKVETGSDDDFIGVVFGLRADAETGTPDSYYLLAWKKSQAEGAPGGLRLARISGTGEIGQRPDLWRLTESDPHIKMLATGPSAGWESDVRYEFRVLQGADGQISLSVKNAETGASIWSATVADPDPLGRGKVGFYNFSQQNVRHWSLRAAGSLPQGNYRLEVFGSGAGLLDAEGNLIDGDADGVAGGNYVGLFTVDIGVPTIELDLQTASDTGVSASDNLTNDNTPTFDLTTNRGGLVEIFADGAIEPLATLTFGDAATQAWTAPTLADGVHAFRVRFSPELGDAVETSLQVAIDTVGPYLLAGGANEQAPLFSRTIRFSEPIDSLGTAAGVVVTLIDPDGLPVTLAGIAGSGDEYTFSFDALIKPGQYSLSANTAIVDLAGNRIDQNRNGVPGEVGQDEPVDRFTLLADTAGPRVVRFAPLGSLQANVVEFEIEFNEIIRPESFGPDDVRVTTPGGNVVHPQAIVQVDAEGKRFKATFAEPFSSEGEYGVEIGPNVADISGNVMTGYNLEMSTVLIFEPQVGDRTVISQNYGDRVTSIEQNGFRYGAGPQGPFTPNIVVDYGPVANDIHRWGTGYGDLENVIYRETDGADSLDITLRADAGYEVALSRFDLAGWPNADYTLPALQVLSGTNEILYHAVNVHVEGNSAGPRHTSIEFDNPLIAETLIIRLDLRGMGGNSDEVGIDNIEFSQIATGISTDGRYRASFTIDKTGPRIIAAEPGETVNGLVSHVDVTFNEAIDVASLSVADVTLNGPGGAAIPVSAIESRGNDKYRVSFPAQRDNGTYSLRVGPNIADLAGNWLDQDQDGVAGEPVDDVFFHAFAVSLPDMVVDSLRTGSAAGDAQSEFRFNETIKLDWSTINQGTAATLGGVSERVWLSTDPVLSSSDTLLMSYAVPGAPVPAGGGYDGVILFSIPLTASRPPGVYYLIVETDGAGSVLEADELNNWQAIAIELTNPPLADLVVPVGSIAAAGPLFPGEAFTLNWQVDNVDLEVASGAWTERVYLSNSPTGANRQLLASFSHDGSSLTPAGAPISRSRQITLPITSLNGSVYFVVEVDGTNNVVESDENNFFVSETPVEIPAALALGFSASDVAEGGSAVQGTVTRNGDASQPLTVTLAPSVAGQVNLPATVTIPAGQYSQRFDVTAVADQTPDGNVLVVINAAAPNFAAAARSLNVVDADRGTLTLTAATTTVTEGGSLVVTVRRSVAGGQPLLVSLATTATSQWIVPAGVLIPADETEAQFTIQMVNDLRSEKDEIVSLVATAAGYEPVQFSAQIVDDDVPVLSLSVNRGSILESDGANPIVATLTRQTVTAAAVRVKLSSSDTSEAIVPAEVIIPAGQASVTFYITPVDDALFDGAQQVVIRANGAYDSCGCTITTGFGEATILVLDDESPALLIETAQELVREGLSPAGELTISRLALSAEGDLTVALSSSNPAKLTVPAIIVIPAGAVSVRIPFATIADGVTTGDEIIMITAAASGLAAATRTITVTDVNVPDLVVGALTLPAAGLTGDSVTIGWTTSNNGEAAAAGTWTERVFLSTDNAIGDDVLVGQYAFTGPLNPGQSYSRTAPIQLPNVPGRYWLIVQTDVAGVVREGLKSNNALVSATFIEIAPAYSATVAVNVEMAPADTPVLLTGTATRADGAPAALQPVNIHLSVRGTKRIIPAVTKADGTFQATFTPLPGEGGSYTVGAAHPGLAEAPVQDSFKLVGMRAEPPTKAISLIEAAPAQGDSLTIRNLADIPLTGLTVEVLDAPTNLQVIASLAGAATTLAATGTVTLNYSVAAGDSSALGGTFRLRISSAEAPAIVVPVSFNVVPLVSRLVAEPGSLSKGMLVGDQTSVEFTVTNTGGKASGPLSVLLPTGANWLKLATPASLPSLAPGASASITLLLTPPANLELTAYNGSLVVRGDGDQVSVPFSFRAVAEETGDLEVTVVDEFFYFGEGKKTVPQLAEERNEAAPTVVLRDAITGELIASSANATPSTGGGDTGAPAALLAPPVVTIDQATGRIKFSGVAAGPYTLEVRSDKHETYRNTIRIDAGELAERQVFVSRNLVEYVWTVEEVEIEDRTRITIDAKFETNVPAPVVVVEGSINLFGLTEVGQEQQFDITITNHGLIAAENVFINPGSHPDFEFKALVTEIGTLPAKSSLTIPITVRRIAGLPSSEAAVRSAQSRSAFDSPAMATAAATCNVVAFVGWEYFCGVPIPKFAPIPVDGACPTDPPRPSRPLPPGIWEFPDGYPGDIWTITINGVIDCPECLGPALLACALGAIPGIGSALSCGTSIAFTHESKDGWISSGGASTVFSCIVKMTPGIGCIFSVGVCLVGEYFSSSGSESPPVSALSAFGSGGILAASASLSWSDEYLTLSESLSNYFTSIFGDDEWVSKLTGVGAEAWLDQFERSISEDSESGTYVTPEEQHALLDGPLPEGIDRTRVMQFLERWQRTLEYNAAGIVDLEDVPVGFSRDFIARDVFHDAFMDLKESYESFIATGVVDTTDLGPAVAAQSLVASSSIFADTNASIADGVCAQVSIQIEQSAVLTRQGFRATLGISNPAESTSLTGVRGELWVTDVDGNRVNDLFDIRLETASTSGGELAAGESERLSWIITPSDRAAEHGNAEYFVGGVFTYVESGIVRLVTLSNERITVIPQPALDLRYFLQRDVLSDDPHTDEIESAQPFTLAVMAQNNGAGAARNFRIESAQPKIVENEKGLLIDFEITGTKVNGGDVQRSLIANFGNIAPGGIGIAEWQMESTLQGHFVDYKVSFQHESPFGDNRLSLIKSATIHELIHVVDAGQVDGDSLSDFLVNDVPDPGDQPDTLYLSDGSVAIVGPGVNALVSGAPALGNMRITMTADMADGWSYLKFDDPSSGSLKLIGVERSDGTMVPAKNFWQTDRTFIGGGQRPTLEDKIHLLDYESTGSYTLIFSNGDLTGPEVVDFAGVVPNPTTQAIDVVDVTFTERLDDATFAGADVALTKNGVPVPLSGLAVAFVSGSTYRISGLAPFTGQDAVYELTIDAAGVTDPVGNAGLAPKTYRWVKGETAPTILSLAAPSGLTTQGPASIDVVFSKQIVNFDASDLSFTRDGVNLLDAQVTITQVGASAYRIGNLARLTGTDGNYRFSVNAAGVQDGAGNAGLGTTTAEWRLDATAPRLLEVIAPATNPRNIVVQQIDVEFSEPIDLATLDVSDLRLIRDGGEENLLAGDGRVTFEDRGHNVYRIKGINWVQAFIADPQVATFTLLVDATGVTDLAGNAGVGLLSSTWTIDLDKPAAATDLALSTFSGVVTGSEVNARHATVAGNLGEAGLTVAIHDMTTNTELTRRVIAGTAFSLPIEFPSVGQHRLRVRAVDLAGNVADAFIENLFVSETPPVLASLSGLPADKTRQPVNFIELTFGAPIEASSLTKDAISISRNGGENLVSSNTGISIVPQPDGKTFRLTGLAAITGDEGWYDFELNLAGVKNGAGLVGSEVRAAAWIHDRTAPSSTIGALEIRQDLGSVVINLVGSDPVLPGGVAPAGIAFFDLYYSDGGAPFQLLETLPASAPTTTFVGEPNRIYYFRSVARDAAGNVESKSNSVDAWTYVPDLLPPVTRVIAVDASSATFDVSLSGTDRGAGLRSFELFVQIDGGAVKSVGSYAAGASSPDGTYSATARYHAIADGSNHQYRFFTRGTDWEGNVEEAASAPADVIVTAQFAAPPQTSVVDFDVQRGAEQRSFIRYLDVFFNTSGDLASIVASLIDGDSTNDRMRLMRYGLDGAGPGEAIDLTGRVSALDQALAIDFGANGLGGDRNGAAGDGYYSLALDLDGNGSLETELAFFRLFGDADGDGEVDDDDLAILTAALGQIGGNLDGDLNGDGRVNALDRQAWQRGRGKAVGAGLRFDD